VTEPLDRFLATLTVVAHEASHLAYSLARLSEELITAGWVEALETQPELAERLEAFVSRYGRMQDTIAAKLLPRLLLAQAETPGSQLETLNRAERLGVLESVEAWLEARTLRDRLVHEYVEDEDQLARDLELALNYARMLIETFGLIRRFASERMGVEERRLP
jgi:hypothetical protein